MLYVSLLLSFSSFSLSFPYACMKWGETCNSVHVKRIHSFRFELSGVEVRRGQCRLDEMKVIAYWFSKWIFLPLYDCSLQFDCCQNTIMRHNFTAGFTNCSYTAVQIKRKVLILLNLVQQMNCYLLSNHLEKSHWALCREKEAAPKRLFINDWIQSKNIFSTKQSCQFFPHRKWRFTFPLWSNCCFSSIYLVFWRSYN